MVKKIWAILLSICMLVSLTAPALAAVQTSGAASTLRLESVTGTAQLKNSSGKTLKATNGTRLYNGHELTTKKASYAFVSLDDTKAIKLDASTSAEVFQSGKKLEMKVNSGQMFFNVTAPLKSDEALNIRTSTMVTGVRGTSGWISVIDRFTTQISLLEGELTVTSTDPLTGKQRTITIVGGQTATIVYHGKDKNYESEIIIEDETIRNLIEGGTIRDEHIILTDTGLTVENLQEEDVPGFVAVEVKNDKELQQKIETNSPLSVPAIIGDAEERLEAEEAAAEAADEAIQEELGKVTADDVDPLFEASTESSGGGGGSSIPTYALELHEYFLTAEGPDGSHLIQEQTSTVNVAQNSTYLVAAPTGYDLESVIENTADTEISYEIADNDNQVSVPVNMDKGLDITYISTISAYLDSPTVTEVTTALGTYDTVYISGTVSTDASDEISLASGKTLYFTGTDTETDNGLQPASALGSGVILSTTEGSSIIVEKGTFANGGDIRGGGTMTVNQGATLENNATIQIESTNSLHVKGNLTNNYTIDVGTKVNPGLLALEGSGTFTNNGILTIATASSVTIASGATLTNGANGTMINDGTITNNGIITGNFGRSFNPKDPDTAGVLINNKTLNPTDDLYSMVLNNSNQVTAWKTMAELFAADGWTNNATHTLVGTQTSSDWSMISTTGQTIILDLNGCKLTLPDIFHISGGSVTIKDSTTSSAGKISIVSENASGETLGNTIVVLDGGALTLESGTIENMGATNDGMVFGTAVQVGSASITEDVPDTNQTNRFTMNGGAVTGSMNGIDVYPNASVGISGGQVSAPVGVYMTGGSAQISGGTINGTEYGIYQTTYLVYDDIQYRVSSTILMTAGTITATAAEDSTAYGVYIVGDGEQSSEASPMQTPGATLTIRGGTIQAMAGISEDGADSTSEAYGIFNSYESVPASVSINNGNYDLTEDNTTISANNGDIEIYGGTAALFFSEPN